MSQSTSLIVNNNNINENNILINNVSVSVKPNDHETPTNDHADQLSDKSPFRNIEFHHANKPFTTNGSSNDSSQLDMINPTTIHNHDRLAFEPFFDRDNNFRIAFIRIGAGLENLGNTCFLNSVLQCLTYTEPLAAYLQSGSHQVTCQNEGFCALCSVQKHVSLVLQSSGESLAPWDLVSNLQYICETFRTYRQEDAHEYMLNLLESLHKCCLPSEVPSQSPSAYESSLVHNIFGGRLRSQVKCTQCNFCSNKFEPFLNLSLEILEADTLYKAFLDFTAKEQLDGGAKQYDCEKCNQKVKALKQLTIHKAPDVLTIHLKRFGSHIWGQKIDKNVHFPLTLNLKQFVTGPYDGNLKYTLYGVLVHAGRSTHSGHYYCFVRTSRGMWYALDDDEVFQVSEKTVLQQKAYMLFYFRDRKNLPLKKLVNVVQQKETVVDNTGQNSAVPFISEEKMGNQKVVSESRFESSPVLVQKNDLVNVPSVLYHMMKSNIYFGKGHDNDETMEVDSTSLGNVGTTPSTSDGPLKLSPIIDTKEILPSTLIEHEEKRTCKDVSSQKLSPMNDQKEALSTTLTEHEEKSTCEDLCPQKLIPMNDQKEALPVTLTEHEEKNTCDGLSPQKLIPMNDQKEALPVTLTEHEEKKPCDGRSPQKFSPLNDKKEALSATLIEHEEKRICDDVSSQKLSSMNDKKEALPATLIEHEEKSTCEDLSPQTLIPMNDQKEALPATLTEHEEKNTCDDLSPQKLSSLNDKKETLSATKTEHEVKSTCEDLSDSTYEDLIAQMISPITDKIKTIFTTSIEHEEKNTHEDLSDSTAVMNCDKPQTAPGVSVCIAKEDVDPAESYSANGSPKEAITPTQSPTLPRKETLLIDKKVSDQKRHKKINNNLKAKVAITKFCTNLLALSQRKKKKHKGKKKSKSPVKNLHVKNMESGSKIKNKNVDINVNRIENEFKERVDGGGSVLGTFVENNSYDVLRRSPAQVKEPNDCTSLHQKKNCFIHSPQVSVPRWEEDESTSSGSREAHDVPSIGYTGDEWDKEYDQGKRKKARSGSSTKFDERNGFQDILNERLNFHAGKRKKHQKKNSKQLNNAPVTDHSRDNPHSS